MDVCQFTGYSDLFTVSQETHDEDGLEAELTALLKPDQSEISAADVVSPTKRVESTTDEDELEARLASLSIGTGQREENGTSNMKQLEPQGKDKSQISTKHSKLPPLPA